MKNNKYRFIDLFAGLGGFHYALSCLGCECVFASELKDDLRRLYEVNHTVTGDITKYVGKNTLLHTKTAECFTFFPKKSFLFINSSLLRFILCNFVSAFMCF